MIGGNIVQVSGRAVEVLDPTYFDRAWRQVEPDAGVRVGDSLWWQSHTGYLSRQGEFSDRDIGRCVACNPHGRESEVSGAR